MSEMLVCPQCGSDRFDSIETGTVIYAGVRFPASDPGIPDYSNADSTIDEAEFEDRLQCRGCYASLKAASLTSGSAS